MSVYDSIIAGLTEAVEDARNEREPLKRHTMEIPEGSSPVNEPNFLRFPIPVAE